MDKNIKLSKDEILILNRILNYSISSEERELFDLKGFGGNPKYIPEVENNLKNLKSIQRKIKII